MNLFSDPFRPPPPLNWLTRRECQMLDLVRLRGLQNKEIAAVLNIQVGTVANGMSGIYRKIGVQSRSEMIIWAKQNRYEAETGKIYSRGLHRGDCVCEHCGRIAA